MHVTTSFGEEQILGLANTIHGAGGHYNVRVSPGTPDHDHLDTPERAHAFLGSHTVPVPPELPDEAQLDRLRAIRTVARQLPTLHDPDQLVAWRSGLAALLGAATYRLDADGRLRAAAPGWDGVADAMLPALLELESEQSRLTHCGNETCRFLFIDRSRSHSRRWCEMAVCGNRVKLRRHRKRAQVEPGPDGVAGMHAGTGTHRGTGTDSGADMGTDSRPRNDAGTGVSARAALRKPV